MTLREDICHSTRTLHDSSVLLRNVIPMTRPPIGFAGEFELGCWEMSSGYLRVFFFGHVRMKKHCSQQYNRGCFYFFYPLLLFFTTLKKKIQGNENSQINVKSLCLNCPSDLTDDAIKPAMCSSLLKVSFWPSVPCTHSQAVSCVKGECVLTRSHLYGHLGAEILFSEKFPISFCCNRVLI